jgi:kynurenine formamidase
MSRLIDLTHTLENDMPVFPGDASPKFSLAMTHARDGAQVTRMQLTTHHGTHLDCPLHFIDGGATTNTDDLSPFYGKALVIDCRKFGVGEKITKTHIEQVKLREQQIQWAVLYTGWYRYWGTQKYFDHFPVLSTEAAEYLRDIGIGGIGLDVISIDAIDSTDFPVHKVVLGSGMYVIENLTNLHLLPETDFMLAAFPLRIAHGDGSPIRAVAIL